MRIQVSVAVALACCVSTAGAADWSFDPKITVEAESNDNHRLTDVPGQEIAVSGAEVDAQLTMRAEAPRSLFRLIPRLTSTLYPGDSQEESNNQYLRLLWDYKGERSQSSLNASYSSRVTLGRFFPEGGVDDGGVLGEPGQGEGIGRSTNRNRQDALEIAPRWAIELTERVGLEASVGHMDVSYDQQVAGDRVDFINDFASVGLNFRLSPTAAVAVSANGSRFKPEDNSSTDSQGLSAEWSNHVSEKSEVFVRGGASRVESRNIAGGTDWNTGFTGGAGVRWSFEITQLFVDFNRYLDPNAAGVIVARDQLRFEISRQLGPRSAISFGARGIRDGRVTNDSAFERRDYAAATVDYDWRFTRQFTLGAGYRYVWRKYQNSPDEASANSLYLGVTYEPHRL